jgi:hexosaminidase
LIAAWLTDYNIRRNFSVPFRVDELMSEENRMYHNVLSMVQSIQESLGDIFDKYTIAEWIEQKLYPTVLRLEELQKASQRLKSLHTWPRRPLPPLTDLLRIGVTVLTNSSSSASPKDSSSNAAAA